MLWRTAPGYLALSTVGGEALAATGPATDIWELLDDWTTVDRIADELAERHGADLDQVRNDVAAFVGQLLAAGYAERAGAIHAPEPAGGSGGHVEGHDNADG